MRECPARVAVAPGMPRDNPQDEAITQFTESITFRLGQALSLVAVSMGSGGADELEQIIREIVRDEMAKVST